MGCQPFFVILLAYVSVVCFVVACVSAIYFTLTGVEKEETYCTPTHTQPGRRLTTHCLLSVSNHPLSGMLYLVDALYFALMFFSQQVVHCLYRVEGSQWHLYKHRVPMAHGSIP